jgi:hypothetical protein
MGSNSNAVTAMATTSPMGPTLGKFWWNEHRSHADQRQSSGRDGAGGNGVRHAALEDQVDVHQAVAEDGVAEGQRQKHQREHRDLHGRRRASRPEQIGDYVEEREGRDRRGWCRA